MNHSFNVEVAKEVGILAATIFNNIGFWVDHNRATGRNLIEGRHWTYNSVRAFAEQFPYATDAQIARALRKLRDAGLLDTGQYCEDKRDRSLWYTLSERGTSIFYGYALNQQKECIAQNNGMDSAKSGNPYISTDINTNGKPDTKQGVSKEDLKAVLDYLNEKTGKHYRLGKTVTETMRARLSEGYDIEDFYRAIDNMCVCWKDTKWERFLQPSTLFRPSKFDGYVNATPAKWTDGEQRASARQPSAEQQKTSGAFERDFGDQQEYIFD